MAVTDTRPATSLTRPDVGPGQLFIAGHWCEASDGARTDVVDPATGRTITTAAAATTADVDAAVTAARAAFGEWRDTPSRHRAHILHRVAELIRERADEIVAVESLDVGKPVTLCRPVDVVTAAEVYEYYAALARTRPGSTGTSDSPPTPTPAASRWGWSRRSRHSTSR